MADFDQLSIRISANAKSAIDNVNNLASALAGLNAQLVALNPSRVNEVSKAAKELQRCVSNMKSSTSDVGEVAKNLSNIGSQAPAIAEVADQTQRLSAVADNAAQNTKRVADTIGGKGASGFEKFKGALQAVGSATKGAFSQIIGFSSMLAGSLGKIFPHAHKASSGLKKLHATSKKTAITSKGLAKELLRVSKMLKLMVTRMALRQIIKEVGNGFKSLALHSKEFDNSMSGMINGSKKLSYSFAAMVSPLINALAPAIQFVINLLVKLLNIINQVFSALSGKSTWNKAKDFTGSWADNIKEANGAAKELKKTVLGFDELNQLQDNSSSGGGGGNDITDMFDTVGIDQKWKDLAEKIKDYLLKFIEPIKKAWANVGDYVVNAWKNAFESVKRLVLDIVDDFLEVWNQPETVAMLENILKIVAHIGEFIGNLADSFDKAWNKADVGKRILEKIRDICAIIVEHVERITDSWAKWAAELDFTPLLESIDGWLESLKEPIDALMGIFEDFNTDFLQPLAKWATEKGGPELLKVFQDFNNKVDWDKLRDRIDRLLKALEKFSESAGEGFIKFIGDVSDKVAEFANSEKWDSFIDTIVKWMEDVDADDVEKGLKGVAAGLGAIVAIKGMKTAADGISAIYASVAPYAPLISAAALLAGLGFAISQLKDDIEKYKKEVGGGEDKSLWEILFSSEDNVTAAKRDYAAEKASNPYLNGTVSQGVKDTADEIAKRAEENRRTVQDNATKIKLAITNAYNDIKLRRDKNRQDVEENKKQLQEKIGGLVDSIVEKFTQLRAKIELKLGEIKTQIKGKLAEIKQDFDDVIKNIKKFFDKDNWTFSGVADGLKSTFNDAIRGVKDLWNGLADDLNGSFTVGSKTFRIGLPRIYATGGFPEDGLFMANHNELVGRFSNGKTAVANNEQITDGIARAVYSAITAANSGGGGTSYINNTITVDGVAIARAVTKGQRSLDRRYSPTMA